MIGNIVVLAIVAALAGLCVRSLWKDHKSGGCSGCSGCKNGCHGSCNSCH
jgi:hypothetical protein